MYPTAPSHTIWARADPRAANLIAIAREGTAPSKRTRAVPRADPFITAVPRRTPGTRAVPAAAIAATTASEPESQYPVLPMGHASPCSRSARIEAGDLSVLAVAIVFA